MPLLPSDPRNVAAWSNKGFALVKQGSVVEGIKAYDQAIAIDPNDEDARLGRLQAIQIYWPGYRKL